MSLRLTPAAARLALALLVVSAGAAAADVYEVDRGDDFSLANACTPADDDCSLRGAVGRANGHPGSDVILFGDLGSFPVVVLSDDALGELLLLESVSIDGGDGVFVAGTSGWSHRIFFIQAGVDVSMKRLLITGGAANNGGGVSVAGGTLLLEESEVYGNTAAAGGGGVVCYLGCQLRLLRSTVAQNTADSYGGGIALQNASHLVLEQSTVSGNGSPIGGGLYVAGFLDSTSSTVADNVGVDVQIADPEPPLPPAEVNWSLTVVAGDCMMPVGASTSLGGSVESPGASCGFNQPTDRPARPTPGLMPLGYHGGEPPTRVHRPMLLGPAVDLPGALPSCGSNDQRHFPRPADADGDGQFRCDAGAVELQPTEIVFWDDFHTGDTSRWSSAVP